MDPSVPLTTDNDNIQEGGAFGKKRFDGKRPTGPGGPGGQQKGPGGPGGQQKGPGGPGGPGGQQKGPGGRPGGLRFNRGRSDGPGPRGEPQLELTGTGTTGTTGDTGTAEEQGPTGTTGSAEEQGPTGTTGTEATGTTGETGTEAPGEEEEAPLGLRLRRNFNQELRQKIDTSAAVPRPNITQMLNVLGDTYNLTPTEGGINIKGGPKSLVTFVTNYGVNPDYQIDVPMTIKAFYNVFDSDGKPKESFDILMRKPAYHFICNHMLYRMVTLKMEIQLQNRSSLRRGELEAMYDNFDEFMKKGKCGFVSKAAAQEAFEREEKNLLVRTGSGSAIATQGLENKLNYIIAILNKFIEDGMRDRLKQLQVNGFDCSMMADALKEFEGTEGMDIDTMIQKYLNLGVSSGGLKVCLGQMKMQASQTGNIGVLIELLGGIKQGTELSDEELDELAKALDGAGVEVGRKTEFESLRQQLIRLKTVVEKGKCTSCAEAVDEESLPVVVEPSTDSTASPSPSPSSPVRSPSPVASRLPIGASQSLKEEHAPGSVGIGSTSVSPDADKNPEYFPTAIPVPLFNAFISSMQVEGEKPLIAFQRLEDLKKKITDLQLENTDLFFIDKAVGFKLLVPSNKDFFKTKFDPKQVIDLGPMPIEGLTKQVKVNVFPIKYNGKYHTFLLVPKESVKKEASPTEATAAAVTGNPTPVPQPETAAEVEKVEPLVQTPVFENQVLEREATPLSGGSPKSPEIEKIVTSPTPATTSESVEKEIIDYGVYDKDGKPIMITPKSDAMQKGPKREPFQLTIRPEFVLPELQVVEEIGITEPVLIHAKSGKPFMPKNGTMNGYVIKKGDKFTWIGEKDTDYVTTKTPTPSATVKATAPAPAPATAPTPAPATAPATATAPVPAKATATVKAAEPVIQEGNTSDKLPSESQSVKKTILEEIIYKSGGQGEENDHWNDLEKYFNIPTDEKEDIRKTDPTRIKLYNIVKHRYNITDAQFNMMRDDIKQYFAQHLVDRILNKDKPILSEVGTIIKEEDKKDLTPILEKVGTQLQTEPVVTSLEVSDDMKTKLSKYYGYLSGLIQTPWLKPSSVQKGGNRIRYTRKRGPSSNKFTRRFTSQHS